MRFANAIVTDYKCIDDSSPVDIDPHVTVLVGQNESGKTAFLEALHKARPVVGGAAYDPIADYPRRKLTGYLRVHEDQPAVVAHLGYSVSKADAKRVNTLLNGPAWSPGDLGITVRYDGSTTVSLRVDDAAFIKDKVKQLGLAGDVARAAGSCGDVETFVSVLDENGVKDDGGGVLAALRALVAERPASWDSALRYAVWSAAEALVPKFLYFDDYNLLPGKVNLTQLQTRQKNKATLPEDDTVLALLRMAGIELASILKASGYEEGKAKLEAISNTITDQVFTYWKQNQELDVEFDIKNDPQDAAPYNAGPNLYVRIRNRRHRVTVPFSQRSKGFVWFFSFLVWFDSVRESLDKADDLVLLLDEPGLSLHALAQADLLEYVDYLAQRHQVVYTTHSPFMVRSERLQQVRTVQDVVGQGTKVSSDVSSSDRRRCSPCRPPWAIPSRSLYSSLHATSWSRGRPTSCT